MLQFYLLAVVLCAVCGYLFAFGDSKAIILSENIENVQSNKTFALVIGLLCLVTGIFKLISPVRGVPVFGDFLPSLALLFAAISNLLDYYKATTTVGLTLPNFFEKVLVENRRYAGIIILIIAFLHFLLPGLLFI